MSTRNTTKSSWRLAGALAVFVAFDVVMAFFLAIALGFIPDPARDITGADIVLWFMSFASAHGLLLASLLALLAYESALLIARLSFCYFHSFVRLLDIVSPFRHLGRGIADLAWEAESRPSPIRWGAVFRGSASR